MHSCEKRRYIHVLLSVCKHVSAQLPLDEFVSNLILGTFLQICRGTPNLVKNREKNVGHFTRRPKYVS